MEPSNEPAPAQLSPEALNYTFQEYQALAVGTDKITDRRQTVNTLFVSINALFLTGLGYLLLQFIQNMGRGGVLFIFGFLVIAIVTTRINRAWLKLSEQNRRLVDLRIRYLKQLEKQLRHGGVFPVVETPLKADETRVEGKNVVVTRGTYTLEDVLYNPDSKTTPFGFSAAEQQIGHTFTAAYWFAFIFSLVVYLGIALILYVRNGGFAVPLLHYLFF